MILHLQQLTPTLLETLRSLKLHYTSHDPSNMVPHALSQVMTACCSFTKLKSLKLTIGAIMDVVHCILVPTALVLPDTITELGITSSILISFEQLSLPTALTSLTLTLVNIPTSQLQSLPIKQVTLGIRLDRQQVMELLQQLPLTVNRINIMHLDTLNKDILKGDDPRVQRYHSLRRRYLHQVSITW